MKELPYTYLPEDYHFFEELQESENGIPKGAVFFGIQIGETNAVLCTYPVDRESSMNFTNPQSVVDYLHTTMEDDEGIVEVGCGETNKGNPIIFNILKKSLYDDGRPGNCYLIHLNLEIQNSVYFIHGVFREHGTTGIRDNAVFAKYRQTQSEFEDPYEGWYSDPYDPHYTKGFLMNISEQRKFDEFFPGHPLTQARAYVNYIAKSN